MREDCPRNGVDFDSPNNISRKRRPAKRINEQPFPPGFAAVPVPVPGERRQRIENRRSGTRTNYHPSVPGSGQDRIASVRSAGRAS